MNTKHVLTQRVMNSITIPQPTTMTGMKRSLTPVLVAPLASACLAIAQAPARISAEITAAYTAVKTNILKTAEKMPDQNYSFRPTQDVRSFAEVLDHVADSQIRTCAAVVGDQKAPGAAGKSTKSDVTMALDEAFAECDKAYGSLSDANAGDTIDTPRGQRSRMGALASNVAHDSEQYGTLAVYLRLKGIIPPSSERPARKQP